MTSSKTSYRWHQTARLAWLGLIAVGILWEMLLAPLHSGGSWAVLKVLPLCFALKGVWQGHNYTMQWASMLIMLYFIEGIVRLSDPYPSAYLAALEIILSLISYFALLAFLRPLKKAAKLSQEK